MNYEKDSWSSGRHVEKVVGNRPTVGCVPLYIYIILIIIIMSNHVSPSHEL